MPIGQFVKNAAAAGALDILSAAPFLRRPLFRHLGDLAYESVVVRNPRGHPEATQRDKLSMILAMLHSIEQGLARGLIGTAARHKLATVFLAKILFPDSKVRREFVAQHKMTPPGFVTISPTAFCNLRCTGCYAGSDSSQTAALPMSVVKRILDDKVRLWGSHFTVVSGGEPFLYKENGRTLLDLFAEHPDQYFLIYTNGTMITRDVARRLGKLGNATPAISVEGLERETDGRRGQGVFNRVLAAAENLRDAGVPFGISTTVTRANANQLLSDDFLEFWYDRQGALYQWMFQYLPIGRGYDLDLMITPQQRLDLFHRTWDLIRNRHLLIADFWNCGTAANGCIAAGGGYGGGNLYVDWNGSVAICNFNPFTVHNIKDVYASGGDLNTVIFSPLFKAVRKWQREYFYDQGDQSRGNLITPCPYRDHNAMMLALAKAHGARALDDSTTQALEDSAYRVGMAEYGEATAKLTAGFWAESYVQSGNAVHRDVPREHAPA